MDGDILAMSGSERDRLDVLKRLSRRELRQGRAAELLCVGVRQVKRLAAAYRAQGADSVVSRQRGRSSNNRLDSQIVGRIETALRERYPDFGATLASEKLLEIEGINVSIETTRQIQIRLGLWKPKRRKAKRVFQLRERRARFGELIQVDGSHHAWFEHRGPRCALMVFIDDATGRLTALQFAPTETARAYQQALRSHVLAHGCPLALYSDRHGVFRVNAKDARSGDGKTEFGRVVERLDIALINATTPQAKGRVERANQTLQDRLVKEMRLRGISTIQDAQAFAPAFIALWNARQAKPPRDETDAHRAWTKGLDALEEALAEHAERVLSKALNFSVGGALYCVRTDGPGIALRGAKIKLLRFIDDTMGVRYKDRTLAYTRVKSLPMPSQVEDEKTIDARIQDIIATKSQMATASPQGRGQRAG